MEMREQDQLSRQLDELCALVYSFLRSPAIRAPYPEGSALAQAAPSGPLVSAAGRRPRVSAAGFVSLLLGASMAMILCGSVTFMIGFILMPWVLGLVMVLYFLGMLSSLSTLGRSIIWPGPASPKSPRNMSGQMFSKLPII